MIAMSRGINPFHAFARQIDASMRRCAGNNLFKKINIIQTHTPDKTKLLNNGNIFV